MSERLYEPIPDIDAYLEHIGIGRDEPSEGYLDELVYAHQCTVPFETLDVNDKHLAPSLAPADLFDKIVVRKRGGYCFELNAAFNALLKGLGFEVTPAVARVLTRPVPHPLVSHRATVAHIGGERFLADVGFGGPMPGFALKLEDGFSRTAHGQTFASHVHDDSWWDIGFTGSAGEEQLVMRLCTLPAEEQDFVPLSFYQSQFPQSVFRQGRRANLRVEDGANNLLDMTYTEFRHGEKTVTELADDADLDRVLADKFGIVDWR